MQNMNGGGGGGGDMAGFFAEVRLNVIRTWRRE